MRIMIIASVNMNTSNTSNDTNNSDHNISGKDRFSSVY